MCDKDVNACLATLKFVPDDIVFVNAFFNDCIGLNTITSTGLNTINHTNINLDDDNLNEDDPENYYC